MALGWLILITLLLWGIILGGACAAVICLHPEIC